MPSNLSATMSLSVLHAIPSFMGGGAERQLSMLAPELCRLGVQTHLAYVHGGVHLASLRMSKVLLHPIPCSGNHDPRILWALLGLIRNLRPSVVHTWLPQMDILAGVAARLTATPFILSERSSSAAYPFGWKSYVRRLVGCSANAVVANSQVGLQYWSPSKRPRHLIRNGLDLAAIRAATPASPQHIGLPPDARIILFAGRLSIEKNVANLLPAIAQVLRSRSDCAAVLFGDGPMHARLSQQIQGMEARDRVRLLGYTTDLWRWMRRASAFVSVSLFEGSPNTVLEAMAIGCPVVLSSIVSHRELADDTMAAFCDPTSIEDIARAIDGVLRDPDHSAKRAAAAIDRADSWSIESIARSYLALYHDLAV